MNRRAFGSRVLVLSAAGPAWAAVDRAAQGQAPDAPAVIRSDRGRPTVLDGVAAGDVGSDGLGVVWARTDRPARMVVEWSTVESFEGARRVVGPAALPETGFAAKAVLRDLPPGQSIFYRTQFVDLADPKSRSLSDPGSFRTPGRDLVDVRFCWGGDVAGQGWGVDPSRGGMRIFDAIRATNPDFFLHSGDHIYADNPIPAEVKLDDGTTWRNLVTEGTSKVAETLEEFRDRYRYNRLDEAVRRFTAAVPALAQWDDHETLNNWYPGEILDDARYAVKSVDLLAARARRAFFESLPIRTETADPDRVYRRVRQGPHVEVFLLDQRTERGVNSANRQAEDSDATAFLGPEQLRWLTEGLRQSTATWKVVASDMPLGLVVRDGPNQYEGLSNGDPGAPSGRERELARLLADLKQTGTRNVVWLTADVHYAAAHRYDPARAAFADFDPFWEFVAGPLHAGTFAPPGLDATFGPEIKFEAVPKNIKANRPPSEGHQFFGQVAVSGKSGVMTVSLWPNIPRRRLGRRSGTRGSARSPAGGRPCPQPRRRPRRACG